MNIEQHAMLPETHLSTTGFGMLETLPRPAKGGRAAMAGFLYQMIVAAGLKVRLDATESPNQIDENGDLDHVLELARDGSLHSELLDQDIVILTEPLSSGAGSNVGAVLIQVKYSLTDQRVIRPSDLDAVAKALERSEAAAAKINVSIVGYGLLTNRSIGCAAKEHLKTHKSKPCSNACVKDRILANLIISSNVSLDHWEDSLRRFGHEYGCLPEEVNSGIDRIVAMLMRQSIKAWSQPLTKRDLIACLVHPDASGHCEVRKLIPEDVRPVATESLTQWNQNYLWSGNPDGNHTPFLSRAVVNEITQKASDHALVVVHGDGGCGKSMALWAWADELLQSATTIPNRAFTVVRSVQTPIDHIVAETILNWSNLQDVVTPRRDDTYRKALDRLDIANPNLRQSRPIFHLGLDGIDEAVRKETELQRVIQWFWDLETNRSVSGRPRATLVVTCRQPDIVKTWLGLERPLPSQILVKVEQFDEEELLEAVRQSQEADILSPLISGRILAGINELSDVSKRFRQGLSAARSTTAHFAPPDRLPESPESLKILQKPVLWGQFLRLSQQEQIDFINGVAAGQHALASRLVKWFCEKLSRKIDPFMEANMVEVLIEAMCRIARKAKRSQYTQNPIWHRVCDEQGLSTHTHVFFRQAELSGIITAKGGSWKWEHDFVRDYLLARGEQNGDYL